MRLRLDFTGFSIISFGLSDLTVSSDATFRVNLRGQKIKLVDSSSGIETVIVMNLIRVVFYVTFFCFFFSWIVRSSSNDSEMLNAKRECMRMATKSFVIGKKADRLFIKSYSEVKKIVDSMNHATRFWIAFKYLRHHSTDFTKKFKKNREYSEARICNILGIYRNTVYRFIKRNPDESLEVLMDRYRFLSPSEDEPHGKKLYFKKIASNYSTLLENGYFDWFNKSIDIKWVCSKFPLN